MSALHVSSRRRLWQFSFGLVWFLRRFVARWREPLVWAALWRACSYCRLFHPLLLTPDADLGQMAIPVMLLRWRGAGAGLRARANGRAVGCLPCARARSRVAWAWHGIGLFNRWSACVFYSCR